MPCSDSTIIQWSLHIAMVHTNIMNKMDNVRPKRTRLWNKYSSKSTFRSSRSNPPSVDVDILIFFFSNSKFKRIFYAIFSLIEFFFIYTVYDLHFFISISTLFPLLVSYIYFSEFWCWWWYRWRAIREHWLEINKCSHRMNTKRHQYFYYFLFSSLPRSNFRKERNTKFI